MEACLCIPWRLLVASVLETLKSQGLKKLVNRLSIAGGWEMCLVTKTTLHKEPLLIIYTVMYYPAESGMWTLSVNWNVRTNQAKNQVLSQCTYIVHVWKWAKKSKINLKNDLILWCSFHKLQQNTKSNNFYKILVLKSCFIAKQIL